MAAPALRTQLSMQRGRVVPAATHRPSALLRPGARHRPGRTTLRAVAGAYSLQEAVKLAQSSVARKLLINGEWLDSSDGQTFSDISPVNEQEILQLPAASAEDVDKAVKAARTAFDEGPWPRMTGKARGKIMYKLAELLEQHADELAALETLDNGKPLSSSRTIDIPSAADHIRYFAGWADKIHGKTIPVDGPYFAYTLHEPLGVIGQIVPWNFPLVMAAWKIAPALVSGNTVVLKPAEQTPLTTLRLGQLALEAGLPPGVLNILTGFGPDIGTPLATHPGVDKLSFTGSTKVGSIIGKLTTESIKPTTLELGGKSPVIIDKDVDIDAAVAQAHGALFFNAGQNCSAGSRTYVHAAVYDEFVEKTVAAAAKRRVGDPFTDVDQGPQVDEKQFKKILEYIDRGKQEGAKLVHGGKQVGDKGFFISPTVFTDVKDSFAINRDEIFGPVQSVSRFESLEEVARRANDTPYGLAAGVFSRNVDTINYLSRSLRTGTVWVNCYNVFDDGVPFGGYKQSGFGRDKGEYALQHYTAVKAVYQFLPYPDPTWR